MYNIETVPKSRFKLHKFYMESIIENYQLSPR